MTGHSSQPKELKINQLKTNTALQMRDSGMVFKAI